MNINIWPFGKKAKPAPSHARGAPVDRVKTLSSQGLSEPEIIRTMKNEGYTPIEVDTAMREVLKGAIGGASENRSPEPHTLPERNVYSRQPVPREVPEYIEQPGPPKAEEFEGEEPPRPPVVDSDMERDELGMPKIPGEEPHRFEPEREEPFIPRKEEPEEEPEPIRGFEEIKSKTEKTEEKRHAIEELVESVIDEKWNELRSQLGNMENRFIQIDSKIAELEQEITRIRGEKKSEIEEIETKIDAYKQSISEISERMESVERAMKDSLTPMLQSLRSLSDTIKTIKENKN